MSPLKLEVLLQYYCLADPNTDVTKSQAHDMAKGQLEQVGALRISPEGFIITPLGRAWVDLILKTKPPTLVECWIDKHGDRVHPEESE